MSKRNYYDVLGVSKDSTEQEIKRAYRKVAMKYHPDRNKEADAAEKFKEATEAYEVLCDDTKRKQYDQFGHAAFDQNQGGFSGGQGGFSGGFEGFSNFGGFEDIFSQFFGGGRNTNAPRKGSDYELYVVISFVESYFGKKIIEKVTSPENGEKEEVTINIPAGIKNGNSIALRGYGGEGINGGPKGDLFVRVKVKEHKQWIRQGNDIHIHVPVSVTDILNENKIKIPTPNGDVEVKVTTSTKSGDVLIASGKGFKDVNGNFTGDLKAHVKLYVPKMKSADKTKVVKLFNKSSDKTRDKWLKDFK